MSSDRMKKLSVKTAPGIPNYMFPRRRRFRGRHLFILLLIIGSGFWIYRKVNLPKSNPSPEISSAEPSVAPPVERPSQVTEATLKPEAIQKFEIRHQTVKPGDTLATILAALGVPDEYFSQLENACKHVPLSQIKEDDELIFVLNRADGLPVKIIYSPSDGLTHTLRKSSAGWECVSRETVRGPVKTVRGAYSENFYDSCIASGLPAALVSNLSDIFAYDIDFTSELKDGDSFGVFYRENRFESGEGMQFLILAAEMTVSGKTFQAYGFQLPDGSWDYFDAKGASLKRAFLKSPFNYRRLQSLAAYRNIKPVLKIYRPHLGIDYAAPRGTPVCAIGDGIVSSIRKSGKKALSIEIKHRGGYKSFYGNLSAYSRGLERGALVLQGEVIGSVGAAGNGKAYLDFHFYKGGKPVNFQTADFARSKSVPKNVASEFEKSREFCAIALQGKIPDEQKQETLSGRD